MIRFTLIFILVLFNATLFARAPDKMWTKTFGDSLIDVDYFVQQTRDQGYIIAGLSGQDVWLIKVARDP